KQSTVINALNPLIRGWTAYYSTVVAGRTFARMRHMTFLLLRSWAIKRHRKKSARWVAKKYWHLERGRWDFRAEEGKQLYLHSQTHIRRHIKVQGTRSPFDGDWVYWSSRLGRSPELSTRTTKLLQRQQGKCAWCGLYLRKRTCARSTMWSAPRWAE